MTNRSAIIQAIARQYPRTLKDAGIGGRVELWLYVNEAGQIEQFEIKTSSGNALLDEAAERIAPQMRFTPAEP